MKEVFILGAGFSKWFSPAMPLLKELIPLLSKNTINDIKKKQVLKIIIEKEKNVEKLLSYLSIDYPWKTKDEVYSDKSLYIRIVKEISEGLLKIQSQQLFDIKPEDNKYKLFSYWYKNRSKILTFNYDNILELTFTKMYTYYDWYYFYDIPIKSLIDRSEPKIFHGTISGTPTIEPKFPTILKLHGSINWLFQGDFVDQNSDTVYHYNPRLKLPSIEINKKGLTEYIIPPLLEKNNYINHYLIKCIWQSSKKEINDADKIIIIGYSFPPSDIYMDLFFKSAINKMQEIVIVNVDEKKEYENKVRKIFSPMYKRGKLNINFITGSKSIDEYTDNLRDNNYP